MADLTGTNYDIIVIGGGIAGLCAALSAAQRARVAIVTEGELGEGCTAVAQGGMAAALGATDSPALHAADTMAAGRGLSDERSVTILTEEAPLRIRDLENWGARFDRGAAGDIALGREAAHSCNRIIHAGGDATGAHVALALAQRLRMSPVTIFEHHLALRLLLDSGARCGGVEVLDVATGFSHRLGGAATILASGGAAALWEQTTNPVSSLGSGVALAYAAGAEVESMEFVQFHPTALMLEGAPRFLISEAVRGEGARLLDAAGERFVQRRDPRGELAPRDVVAQAIWDELRRSGRSSVALDCRDIGDRFALRFPTIDATCRGLGIDPSDTPIPVAPAAHYTIGGVRTDLSGATTVDGLYACGEVASNRLHGANRLASNSLIEGTVFGRRSAEAALSRWGEAPPPVLATTAEMGRVGGGERTEADSELQRLRLAMWRDCGIVRDAAGLREARRVVGDVAATVSEDATVAERRVAAAAVVATLIVESALFREESRGAHLRLDYPNSSDHWHGTVVMQSQKGVHLDRHT